MLGKIYAIAAVVCILFIGACGDDESSSSATDVGADTGEDAVADAVEDMVPDTVPDAEEDADVDTGGQATALAAVLTGGQEAPDPVDGDGSGTAVVTLSADQTEIRFTVEVEGLTGITDAHIHSGGLGEAGPVIFPLPGATSFSSPLNGSLTEDNLTPAGGIDTFADAVEALLAGETYVNVHTSANPAGEIRGQLGEQSLRATLTGDAEAPNPVTTDAVGGGSVTIAADHSAIEFELTATDITGVTDAHIHVGASDAAGPVIFPLPGASSFTSPLTGTLTDDDLTPNAGQGIETYEDAIGAILDGRTYFNVHTTANPGGEIRGQIEP